MLTRLQEKKLEHLFRAFDADANGLIKRADSEWHVLHDQLPASPDAFEIVDRRTAEFMFARIDRDGDGEVNLGDHRDLLRVVRVDPGPWADENFCLADTDGALDDDEVATVRRDFSYDNDPSIPASSWLGPVA